MSPETFIRQHITTALVAEGFSEIVAQGGGYAWRGALPEMLSGQPEGKHVC
ncbi:hypothetical protein GN496_14165 [Salmonella enterica]|nr:hypothetical protein [Salmonella enterica]